MFLSITHTEPKSWAGCTPPTDDERLAEFYWKYFSAGQHHKNEDGDFVIDNEKETNP
jgi:hypothetical protein